MTDKEKIEKAAVVKKYLQELFPGCDVQTKWDFDSGDLLFTIEEVGGKAKHRGKITRELLEHTETEKIPEELDRQKLKSCLDRAGTKGILFKERR